MLIPSVWEKKEKNTKHLERRSGFKEKGYEAYQEFILIFKWEMTIKYLPGYARGFSIIRP